MTETAGKPTPPPLPETFQTDLTVGEILRRTRTHYNLSFDQVERDLRIKAEHIEALEHNAIESLPGRVYVFGFVRTYSEYLGLDGEKMVSLLKRQAGRKVEKVRHILTMPMEDDEEHKAPGWQIVAGTGAALLAALVVIGSLTSSNAPDVIPPVPQELSARLTIPEKPKAEPVSPGKIAEAVQNQLAAGKEMQGPPAPEPAAVHPVVLKAIENTWLEIRDANRKVIFSRVLNQGEEYWVPQDQTGLTMMLGNAGGLQIVLDGQPLPLLGAKGQVRRNVALSPDILQKSLKKPNKKQ